MGQPGSRGAVRLSALVCCSLLLLPLLALPADGATLRVATQNLNRLFDDVDDGNNEKRLSRAQFTRRVESAAEKFGGEFGLPHIIALQEVENLNVLRHIAAAIERRFGANYQALLIEGNDVSGIDVGFLVHAAVEVRGVEQLFARQTFSVDGTPLFSRPPLYLQACYVESCLILLNLHLRSMRGIDDKRRGSKIRQKRLQQAETIAAWSQRLQQSRPRLSLLLLGDFNALTPPDAHVDVAGILRGNPESDATALRGRDLLAPDLVDLTASIPPAFVFRRQKQQLDYMLVNRNFAGSVERIAFSPIDYRFSDHAALLAWFDW